MLEALPWPRHLKNVPEYAGGHHERMDGKGYPRGLKRDEMSVQARCMGIADIFEALTATDRPYKRGKTLSEALEIMGKFKLNGQIDPDLFDVFIWERVYLKYARKYMNPSLIDRVDLSRIPGYTPPPNSTEPTSTLERVGGAFSRAYALCPSMSQNGSFELFIRQTDVVFRNDGLACLRAGEVIQF